MRTHLHVQEPARAGVTVCMGTHVQVELPRPGDSSRGRPSDCETVSAFLRLLCVGLARRATGRVGVTAWGWETSGR
jgi:hypothetical protein